MYKLNQVNINKDLDKLIKINGEYLDWANKRLKKEYNIEYMPFDETYNDVLERYASESSKDYVGYQPPDGIFYLINNSDDVIGMGGLKKMKEGIAEIKRMYIQPAHRGHKLGKKLFNQLIEDAKKFGFDKVRLDSAGFMSTAHHIYKSFGFKEIDPYPESEIPDEYKKYWIFMETSLK